MENSNSPTSDRFGVVPFLIFLGLSATFFGRALAGVFSHIHIGKGPDCALLMWDLVWWPHAIMHHRESIFQRSNVGAVRL
jgi:hypothetical protein